jgi:hypothetical protein
MAVGGADCLAGACAGPGAAVGGGVASLGGVGRAAVNTGVGWLGEADTGA